MKKVRSSQHSSPKKKPRDSKEETPVDEVTKYAQDVNSGAIIAGKYVRLACRRHIQNIENQESLGIIWRPDLAQKVFEFFLKFLSVEANNEAIGFNLEPFQKFIVGSLFGWLNVDGSRRYRDAYIEIGKGNGKTPMAAGIGIKGLIADGELSPEIYSAATMRDQASICFKDAVRMVQRSPQLAAVIEERVGSLNYEPKGGIFRPLSSEHKALDGKRPHIAIIDELHEHPSSMVVDKMRLGIKRRRNPLILRITNSGDDITSVCWAEHEYSTKILEGSLFNESWFAYICCLDENDDFTDYRVWIKANPGLGTILPIKYLQDTVKSAQGMPTKRNIVKRLNFCIWTEQHSVWIPQEQWQACNDPIDYDSLLDRECWAGLDLSSKLDLTALVLVFRRPDESLDIELPDGPGEKGEIKKKRLNLNFSIDILPFFFIPESTMGEREREDRIPYRLWAEQGFIYPTPGNIIDYDFIYDYFKDEIAPKYSVQQIGFDPYNAASFALNLQSEGFLMVEVRQGAQTMSEPSKIFQALIKGKKVRHGNHPVLNWNMSNIAAKEDKKENIFPYKQHEKKRIDGGIASIIALSRMVATPMSGGTSVYESRGIITL
jgi:phage terminase large subunit-like protein